MRLFCSLALSNAILLLSLLVANRAAAVEPPVVSIERTAANLVSIGIEGGVQSNGFNVYRGNTYVTTARPPEGTATFSARVGPRGGAFCIVAFDEADGMTSYSACSASVDVEAADPDLPDELSGPPTAPGNLRATVYSPGVVELFWDRASDDGRVVGYRLARNDNELPFTTGRSLFQPELDPNIDYRYTVTAIDDDDNTGPAASITVRAVPGSVEPPPPGGDGEPPAPPTAFRGVTYSPGVVEIFWSASPDAASLSGYEVLRDGNRIAFTQGRSVFQTGLSPGQLYTYELTAIGAGGERSDTLMLLQRAGLPPPGPDYAVFTTPEQIVVTEGEADATIVDLQIQRPQGTSLPIALSILESSAGTAPDLVVQLEPEQLSASAASSRLSLSLPVAMGPRLPEERELILRLDDGETIVDTPLSLRIEPIDAPDVYLMIGQSNMEGYSEIGAKQDGPGEPDEPTDRLQQLHVNANNARFFSAPEDFVDEAANTREPLFIPAEDPLHDLLFPGQPAKSGTFIGPSLSFGKAALADTSRKVYLVPAAWGATGFCANANGDRAWNAAPTSNPELGGTLLLERALTRLEITLRETEGVLRGILWHQGGADSNNPRCAERYADNLVAMVERLRTEARVDARGPEARGPEASIPFVVATQSRGKDSRADFSIYNPFKTQVDDVHRNIAQLIPLSDVVINDDLVPPAFPCGQTSCVHFGAAALREQGVRFHAALERIRTLQADIP